MATAAKRPDKRGEAPPRRRADAGTSRPTKVKHLMVRLDDEQKRLVDEYFQGLIDRNEAESGSAWVRTLLLRIVRDGWRIVPPERSAHAQ